MFVVGRSVRRIARFHRVAEQTVENELRAVVAEVPPGILAELQNRRVA